jgi:ribonuclease HI
MEPWVLHFDGGCEPRNPGGRMTWAWVLKRPGVADVSGAGSVAPAPANTNNVAEWWALGHGLKAVAELCGRDNVACPGLLLRGDSRLVVEQFNGGWACNKPHLEKLRDRCRVIARGIPGAPKAHAEWVKREENEEADALGRQAYFAAEGKMPPERRKSA